MFDQMPEGLSGLDVVSILIIATFIFTVYKTWHRSYARILIVLVIGAVIMFVGHDVLGNADGYGHPVHAPAIVASVVLSFGSVIAFGALISLVGTFLTAHWR